MYDRIALYWDDAAQSIQADVLSLLGTHRGAPGLQLNAGDAASALLTIAPSLKRADLGIISVFDFTPDSTTVLLELLTELEATITVASVEMIVSVRTEEDGLSVMKACTLRPLPRGCIRRIYVAVGEAGGDHRSITRSSAAVLAAALLEKLPSVMAPIGGFEVFQNTLIGPCLVKCRQVHIRDVEGVAARVLRGAILSQIGEGTHVRPDVAAVFLRACNTAIEDVSRLGLRDDHPGQPGYEVSRLQYRDRWLAPLLASASAASTSSASLVELLAATARTVRARSVPLASLLADIGVSLTLIATEQDAFERSRAVASYEARRLAGLVKSPIVFLLPTDLAPVLTTEDRNEYNESVRRLREVLIQEGIRSLFTNLEGEPSHQAQRFLFVPPDMQADTRDELWPLRDRIALFSFLSSSSVQA